MAAPDTALTVPTRPALREEGLRPGRAWVHPDTRLEYEDYHAFFAGDKPLVHWRNTYLTQSYEGIRNRLEDDLGRRPTSDEISARVHAEYERICRYYSRDGFPFAAR